MLEYSTVHVDLLHQLITRVTRSDSIGGTNM